MRFRACRTEYWTSPLAVYWAAWPRGDSVKIARLAFPTEAHWALHPCVLSVNLSLSFGISVKNVKKTVGFIWCSWDLEKLEAWLAWVRTRPGNQAECVCPQLSGLVLRVQSAKGPLRMATCRIWSFCCFLKEQWCRAILFCLHSFQMSYACKRTCETVCSLAVSTV